MSYWLSGVWHVYYSFAPKWLRQPILSKTFTIRLAVCLEHPRVAIRKRSSITTPQPITASAKHRPLLVQNNSCQDEWLSQN